MDDIKTLSADQIKDIQTLIKSMLAPAAGDKKISQLDAIPSVADADLLPVVDATDNTTKKSTALQIKDYVGTGQEAFDATVGNVGSGADYNSQEDAIVAGKFNLLIIGNFNETKDVNVGATSVRISIADTCNMGTFQYFTGGAGDLKLIGKVTYAYTSPGQLVTHAGTGTLDMSEAITDGTACTAVASIAVGNVNNRMQISNCRCYLANTSSSGFENAYNSSSIANVTFIGGGAACTGAIVNLPGGIASNITFEGTIQNLGEIIKLQNYPSVLSGVKYNATNRGVIGLYVGNNQIDNISGDLKIDTTGTSRHHISNCNISDLDLSSSDSDDNKFSNIYVTNGNIVIGGDRNEFVNFEVEEDVTINGSNNWFSNFRAEDVIVNGNSNESIIASFSSYTDNGSNNSYITNVSKDGTLAANDDLSLVTMKAIKTYADLHVLLAGAAGGQTVHGGTLTNQTLDLLNNLIDQLGIHIAGDGKVTIDRDTTIGQSGTASVAELKNASDVVKVKLNTVGDSYLTGGNLGLGTTTPLAKLDNQGSKRTAGREINATTGSLNATDFYLQMFHTATAPINFSLIASQTYDGREIEIKDSGDNASTNNITLTPAAGDTIEKLASFVINGDGESYSFRYDLSNTNWEIF
jgi:hypothetical protein